MLAPACFRNLPPHPPSFSDTRAPRPARRSGRAGLARGDACSTPPVAMLCQLPEFCNSHLSAGFHRVPGPHNVVRWARSAAHLAAGKLLVRDGGLHGVGGWRVVGGSSVRLMRGVWTYLWAVAGVAVAAAGIGSRQAAADTLEWALVQAYQNNPSLNAQLAALRATDENVPQALSGYRPKLSLSVNGGAEYQKSASQIPVGGALINSTAHQTFYPRIIGANATYTLFNGLQTANRTRQAESQVMAARETLRVTEQQVLLDAATAYMNLLRDAAILELNRRNVEVLTEQLKQTRDRFNVGEVTRTDVAQAESRLAAGRSALLGAQSNYVTSQANYRRVIGVDPGRLGPGTPVDRLSPRTLARAIVEGQQQSPTVRAAMYGVDIAELAVKISEGALYPNLAVIASASQGWQPAFETLRSTQASVLG